MVSPRKSPMLVVAAAALSSAALAPVELKASAASARQDICAPGEQVSTFKCQNRWVAHLKTSYR
jgi:hypothetical protein